jgi:hypothetical protein
MDPRIDETLKAVWAGILTDQQLKDAITHYQQLVDLLSPHGDIYALTYRDACQTLDTLRRMKYLRED